jgi:hypothetical protein
MRSLFMLRLAARSPCRSGPVTSTLGRTFKVAPLPAQSKPRSVAAVGGALRSRRQSSQSPPSPCFGLLPVRLSQGVSTGRCTPASVGCGSNGQQVSCGWRFAPACCAAQSVHGRAACVASVLLGHCHEGGAIGHRTGSLTAGATSSPVLARRLFIARRFSCQRSKARPNMSVNRSLHGMPPWPRSALCPCCASRPGRHAVPARLPLR